MIIAIAGDSNQSIGSGKDTVGRIIQYLFTKKRCEPTGKPFYLSISEFLEQYDSSENFSFWEIKKFAEAPKNIVCLLTGCKRADLENEDFKNQELSEEWWTYDETVIKNWLLKSYSRAELESDKNIYLDNYKKSPLGITKLTYRKLMQLLATEAGRDIVHPNIWVNSLMKDYKEVFYQYVDDEWNQGYSEFPNWIITDLRFPNEYKAVKDRKGLCIKVTRTYGNIPDIYAHSSETALNNHEFDYIIENNGTIDDLVVKVEEFLIKFNLLD